MKHLGKLSVGLIALLMSACSSDEPINTGGGTQAGENDVYASLTMRLPASNGTRADSNGIEIGQEYENSVGQVIVVLAVKNGEKYTVLTKAKSDAHLSTSDDPSKVRYVLNFSSKEMDPQALPEGSVVPGNDEVYVFAYCNPTDKLLIAYEGWENGSEFTGLSNSIDDKDNAQIWRTNRFLMTNSSISKAVKIPARSVLVRDHNTAEKALNLGTVEVKRAAARFDFMVTTTDAGVNKYTVEDATSDDPIGVIELTDMAMFNISQSFYYLPRSNSKWNWGGLTTLCADTEDPDLFVMSTNRDLKQSASLSENITGLRNAFFYNLVDDLSTLDWVSIRNWDKDQDNHDSWTHPDGTLKHDYRIWRYTTENTIPAIGEDNVRSQRAGITTGVAFRAEFTPANTEVWNGNAIYVYKGVVYGDYKTLKEYAEAYEETEIAKAFKAEPAFRNVAADFDHHNNVLPSKDYGDFEVYTAVKVKENDKDVYKYIMYYFYFNRHNNNGVNTSMGINEFGVVRNNVYKLRVTTVKSLGRPDKPGPDTEDEEENAYFSVSCIVMPWTVRVNDIEF